MHKYTVVAVLLISFSLTGCRTYKHTNPLPTELSPENFGKVLEVQFLGEDHCVTCLEIRTEKAVVNVENRNSIVSITTENSVYFYPDNDYPRVYIFPTGTSYRVYGIVRTK